MSGPEGRLPAHVRREQIVQLLVRRGDQPLPVEELAATFGISPATARRDLEQLRGEGRITRTYGGAVLGAASAEQSVRQRELSHAAEKDAIARVAADLVQPDSVVLLDAGSTTERLARQLRTIPGLTVVTNGVAATTTLLESGDTEIVVLGGRLRRINQTISGSTAEQMVRGLYADVAFIGADAVDPRRGIASRTLEQSVLKSVMAEHARTVAVVADSTKLSGGWTSYWSPLQRPWLLLTDDGADPGVLESFRTADPHVEVVVCPVATTGTATG
ncbi:DeoR/GlpR family DNA-binding transcription regulator [Geodermatophilus sp. YIM 151500]|uniref:DeoR/GlpR family DNA-binding transcription regulator n=1 Tax=Geodermatophilus sp. YIM 151500 TaxID=2984531 RepID=UPI0021E3AF90|nr:DeoR/GlpR family DNA-binding transcription regulator [Geodermatophilus sp. YIM 151500]MCV2488197.1 DeoR/GlpR family DNA-binding transcription regulator [Geodermatophilus sp. YIM 151500]